MKQASEKNALVAAVIGLVLAVLSGCASVPMAPREQESATKSFAAPSADSAGLYVFRNSFVGQSLRKLVSLDGNSLGETANKVYFYVAIAPGSHTLSTESEFGDNAITFDAVGGKNYFVRQHIKMGVATGGAALEMVDEGIGKIEVLQCRMAKTFQTMSANEQRRVGKITDASAALKPGEQQREVPRRADQQALPFSGRQLVGEELRSHFVRLGSVTGNWRSGGGLRLDVRSSGGFWVRHDNFNSAGTSGTYRILRDAGQICLSVRKLDWKNMELCYELFDVGNGRFRMQSVTNGYYFTYSKY